MIDDFLLRKSSIDDLRIARKESLLIGGETFAAQGAIFTGDSNLI